VFFYVGAGSECFLLSKKNGELTRKSSTTSTI